MAKRITARKKQALETRGRIQSVALDLFDRNGFENVSVEEIAQAAGCSVGNIYHYFKSKDELVLQVTDHVDAAYLELEKDYAADTKSSARDKLLDFVGRTLTISVNEEVLYKSLIHALRYPGQGALKIKDSRVWFRMLREFIDACKREGSVRADEPTDEILAALVTLHRGMLMQWRIEEGAFPIEERGRRIAAAYLRGLSPEK